MKFNQIVEKDISIAIKWSYYRNVIFHYSNFTTKHFLYSVAAVALEDWKAKIDIRSISTKCCQNKIFVTGMLIFYNNANIKKYFWIKQAEKATFK